MSPFLNDCRRGKRFDGNVSVSVYVDSGVPLGRVLGQILFILYTSKLFRIVENHMVGHADDDTTI